ncbi:MAG: hypothetical protein ACI8PT_003434 [Gammaproteobacteria bacterium]|jgi:hypothetical protein
MDCLLWRVLSTTLDEAGVNALCRERGIYAHHVAQWKHDFVSGTATSERANTKSLKGEVRDLKKELHRKDKALAETAALLVLQKTSVPFGETTRTNHSECSSTSGHRPERENIATLGATGQYERRAPRGGACTEHDAYGART